MPAAGERVCVCASPTHLYVCVCVCAATKRALTSMYVFRFLAFYLSQSLCAIKIN